MVPIHTDTLALVWTVVFHTRRAVLIIHTLCASVLPGVAQELRRTIRVFLAGSPGVPGGLTSDKDQAAEEDYQHQCSHTDSQATTNTQHTILSPGLNIANPGYLWLSLATGCFNKKYPLLFTQFLGFQNILKCGSVHFSTAQPLHNPKMTISLF